MNRLLSVAALAAIVILGACAPAASSSSGEPSSQASAAASEAQASGGDSLPSVTAGAAADLEALIPDTVGGLVLQKQSMAASEFLVAPESDPATIKFIEDLGVSPSDVSIAFGFGFSTDTSSSLVMFVFRAAGAETGRLVSVFKEATDASRDSPLTWSSTQVAGKQVEVSAQGDSTIYLYATGDTLFFISGDDASTAEAIGGLP